MFATVIMTQNDQPNHENAWKVEKPIDAQYTHTNVRAYRLEMLDNCTVPVEVQFSVIYKVRVLC